MTPREMAEVLLRPFGSGSVLPEPSASEVYEGRLSPTPARGLNLLDVALSEPKGRLLPAGLRDDLQVIPAETATATAAWVPWCVDCRLEPVGGPWSLGGAEYLARAHDVVHHHGVWTAQARPAAEVAELVAGGAR